MGGATDNRLVVVTGGEPMLQLDEALVGALHDRGFRVRGESNGTLAATAESTGCASARRRAPRSSSGPATS